MTKHEEFLQAINNSYEIYKEKFSQDTDGARSNAKLYPLHGCIAKHLQDLLGQDYLVHAQGIGDNREKKLKGRYYPKTVDIAIERDGKFLAAIEVKFVMSSFKKNATNYFENMLGQTANIRSNQMREYQIFILPVEIPLLKKDGSDNGREKINDKYLKKYLSLGNDNADQFFHTPDKTLVILLDFDGRHFIENQSMVPKDCGPAVLFNQYDSFIKKVYHGIKAI